MKLWYDVSGIYNWTGNFTGIQRVVYNLGKQLHDSGDEVGFFVYRHGTFQEVSFAELETRLQANVTSAAARAANRRLSLGKIQHHTALGLKGVVRGTPLEPSMRAVYGGLRKTYRVAHRSGQHVPVVSGPFTKDDIVVVVDGNWQFGGYAQAIMMAKSRAGFTLMHFVHDLTAVRNPALVNPGAERIIGGYFKEILPAVDVAVAVSESTKHDLEWFANRVGLPIPNIEILISGDNNISQANSKAAKKPAQAIPQPFILSVSTIEVRKNYTALYYAYKLAKQRGIELPHLVIAGKKGWMAEEVYALLTKDIDIRDKITVLLGPDDRELSWLYTNCCFTVFPSYYEGWGIPVGESFMYGKACISSDTSSMPEVGKDLAIYISPYNPEEIMNNIVRLDSDNELLKRLESNIKANYHTRTWSKARQEFIEMVHKRYAK